MKSNEMLEFCHLCRSTI